MADTKGGLSYTSDTPEEPATPATFGASVPSGKGKSQTIANENVLEQMSRLYEQKKAQQESWQERLRDAKAWFTGMGGTQAQALQGRAEERDKQAAELFKMQQDIAAQKAALQNRDLFFGNLPGISGTAAQPEGGAGAQPTVSGAAGASGAQAMNTQTGGLLGLVQDPALRFQIGAQYLSDPTKAMGQLNQYLAKRAEEPQVKKEVDYLVSQGMPREKALPIAIVKVAGAGALVPHDVRTPSGTQQTTPLAAAGTYGGAQAPAAPAVSGVSAAPAPAAAPAAKAPVAAPTAAPATTSITAQPLSQTQYQFKPTGFAPGSKEDLDAKSRQYESYLRAFQEEQAGRGKTDATTAETLEAAGEAANKNIRTYEAVKNILHETPRAVGIAYRSGPGSAAIKFVEEGASIPFAGSLKIPGMEEAVARGTLTPKELENRAVFNGLVGDLSMAYRKDVNKGMGSQSDADAKAADKAFGLSDKNPAKANLIFAVLQMEKEKLAKARYDGWVEYQKRERAAGKVPEFRDYKLSDTYLNAAKENDRAIREQLPDLFKEPGSKSKTAPTTGKTKSGATHSGW